MERAELPEMAENSKPESNKDSMRWCLWRADRHVLYTPHFHTSLSFRSNWAPAYTSGLILIFIALVFRLLGVNKRINVFRSITP